MAKPYRLTLPATRKPEPAQPTPATVADELRAEGARLAEDYWRRWAELEKVRRRLAALDRVLTQDYPIIHAGTGRAIASWISPDRWSAPEAMRAMNAACAELNSVEQMAADWRARAAELLAAGAHR